MPKSFNMSLFMPPISPMKDGATGKTVKSATLTPLRTLELNEVYQLITANKRLITLTQAIWKIQCKLPPKTKRFCPLVLK
jgi:hypothetical protein